MRPEDSLYSFTTHFHNIWRLCDCISQSLCHIWKSPHINKMQKERKTVFFFFIPPPSIGENKRCFKSAFYSPSWMLDPWRKQWRVEQRHGGMRSEGPLSHYRKPGPYLSAAEHLLCLPTLFFSPAQYIAGRARETLKRPTGPRLCVYGRSVPPRSNKNHPVVFTVLPSAEDARVTFIQITARYSCTLLSYDFIFFFYFFF